MNYPPIDNLWDSMEPLLSLYTYLGVVIDEDMKFDAHVNNLIKRCNQKICTLSKSVNIWTKVEP